STLARLARLTARSICGSLCGCKASMMAMPVAAVQRDDAGGLLQRQSVIGDGHFLMLDRRRDIQSRQHRNAAADENQECHANANE
ncbi:MAG TPA: hypothetical protein VN229_19260, partial [Terriglobales bacterium]|nr:hypothetical protein [Terriglobales bacterium]